MQWLIPLIVVQLVIVSACPKNYEEDWVFTRSRCDRCKRQIKWYDNIPLLSYLLLRGKCRFCHKTISLDHPVMELLAGALFVWWYTSGFIFFQLSLSPFTLLQPLFWLVVGMVLLAIVLSDFLYMIIPDFLVGILMALVVLYRFLLVSAGIMQWEDLIKSVIAMFLATAFIGSIYAITKGKGMGLGDVKLMLPLGLLLGWPKVLVALFLSFIIGAIVALFLLAMKKKKMGQVIPFGPFLVLATVISLMWGNQIFAWYLSLL